jgi:phosphoenolpyruvate carboxykinase (ATP)
VGSDPFPEPKSLEINPSPEKLKEYALAMPNARLTEFDNVNVQTRVTARSKSSTYIVSDDPSRHSDQTISRSEYEAIAKLQNDYIAEQEMIEIRGYIGVDPNFRVPARLVIEKSNANIAAMQRQLYYPLDVSPDEVEPQLTVIYTPNLAAPGYPNDRVIAVDLDSGVTRVLNSDYFGESKKGGLRMWNALVYERGGLALHAGCKVIPVDGRSRCVLVVGLSGTGKTTTTFTRQNNSLPVQDDFIALMEGGKIHVTENGCFAKTFGLDPKYEPTIYGAVTKPDAYLENVAQDNNGKLDFYDDSYTQNGRATFELSAIPHEKPDNVPAAEVLLILNRNENIIPAVAKLNPVQAAAFFMLGETQGTSAGGADEAGKFLRVPGTNPFFPLQHGLQGNRILELLQSCKLDVYLMNTGRIGGPEGDERSKKVAIPHSSAIVKAIAEDTIEWEEDPDFGYLVAREVPGIDKADADLLRPRLLYERQGRMDEYNAIVERLKRERYEFLSQFETLHREIVESVA